ncbi:bacteriohemerythrin [Candidatus Dependentiae bacterium]|nr:bacteriohemerythrin [Candidatus Dependentiae bacterium]
MQMVEKIRVSNGIFWIGIEEADLYILCGCPADSVKHLMKKGLIVTKEKSGVLWETGPNAILLSDIAIQNGSFSNLAEFPVLQMLYRQGMILPNHPNNKGNKPVLIGSKQQVYSQMQYIYRGNYGFISVEELMENGVSSDLAQELYRMKLKFAFGKISKSEELLDKIIIDKDEVEIKNNVFIKRIEVNVFKIRYKNESVEIDLNLKENEKYESPFKLGSYCPNREYFAVIHSGEGDGWDTDRPAMASILMYQGRYYLIDCGPNIDYTLNQLGISVSEIEGIFHTHCHDDHFNGLTSLIRADHKIKYFAESSVRATVKKKLSALISKSETEFENFFDIVDLKLNEWNDINSLEVQPVISPHPVETTILFFRTPDGSGYKTYAHLADITDLNILSKMITAEKSGIGINQNMFDTVKEVYLRECDLKKVDIGGGLIHGNALDFKSDSSKKIILAHTSLELNSSQKEIGSSASFGMIDSLIDNYSEYDRLQAYRYLVAIFPDVEKYKIDILLNNKINVFNPGTIIMKTNECQNCIFLLLSGNVELIFEDTKSIRTLSPGSFIGNIFHYDLGQFNKTYRSVSYVKTLNIPLELFEKFVDKNCLIPKMKNINEIINFMNNVYLFGDSLSYPVQNRIADKMILKKYPKGYKFSMVNVKELYLLKNGKVKIHINGYNIETIEKGGFWNESIVLFGIINIFCAETAEESEIYSINEQVLSDIPVIRWKMMEEYDRRLKKILNIPDIYSNFFKWDEAYSTGNSLMDDQHKKLIFQAGEISESMLSSKLDYNSLRISKLLNFLIDYTKTHFSDEEQLMEKYKFPEYKEHCKKHIELISTVNKFAEKFDKNDISIGIEFLTFLKAWIIDHIINDDRKYSKFLKN